MHKPTVEALSPPAPSCPVKHDAPAPPASGCPVPHGNTSPDTVPERQGLLSKLNPLNYMFSDLSQAPAANQKMALPTTRDESSIPKGSGDGNWEYPSPQQMYNALLRKGYTDTDPTAVESMVAVHNFLNEGAWAEIVDWERRFGRGLSRGWQVSRRGEENAPMELRKIEAREGEAPQPTLVRFQGRPKDMTPKAFMLQVAGWLYPEKFGCVLLLTCLIVKRTTLTNRERRTEPPFDRHDWFVSRNVDGQQKQIRYVIDYYSGEPEPTGEPVFYLDVRPALTPTAAAERLIRWGGDVWWRASGGEVREQKKQ